MTLKPAPNYERFLVRPDEIHCSSYDSALRAAKERANRYPRAKVEVFKLVAVVTAQVAEPEVAESYAS